MVVIGIKFLKLQQICLFSYSYVYELTCHMSLGVFHFVMPCVLSHFTILKCMYRW